MVFGALKRTASRYFLIIKSFKPGEVTPELALDIAKEFAAEHLADYEVVIGTHVDKDHIPHYSARCLYWSAT
ncbi:MAG: relaxase/mobilization nuclease domain-containing protein [Lachnospiraceae bacterium]